MPSRSSLCVMFVLMVGGLIAYSGIAAVPFYLDDYSSILNNPLFHHPLTMEAIWHQHSSRFVTYSVLAIQQSIFGFDASYFHVVSLVLHLLTGLIVYKLLLLILERVQDAHGGVRQRVLLAACISLIFLVHPQNSQAVVYVVQQGVLLTALFYLAALLAYAKARIAEEQNRVFMWLFVAALCSVFAVFSKQNAVTLPIAILLLEAVFFKTWLNRLIMSSLVTFLAVVVGSFALLYVNDINVLTLADSMSRETDKITREEYFANQGIIIGHYLTQFLWPVNLRLEYDFALVNPWHISQVLAWCVHGVLILASFLILKRFPLVGFGILFYYTGHLVESTIIPIKDLAFEHRTYLPNVGLCITAVSLVFYITSKLPASWPKRTELTIAICSVAILIAGYATYKRVGLWQEPLYFYENEISLSPKSARAYATYAQYIADNGNCPLAIGYFSHAMALYEKKHVSSLGIQPEMVMHYIRCLRKLGIHAKAEKWQVHLLNEVSEKGRRGIILTERGTHFLQQRDFSKAEAMFVEALQLNPNNYAALINLAVVKASTGEFDASSKLLLHVLSFKPQDDAAKQLLLKVQQAQGR